MRIRDTLLIINMKSIKRKPLTKIKIKIIKMKTIKVNKLHQQKTLKK